MEQDSLLSKSKIKPPRNLYIVKSRWGYGKHGSTIAYFLKRKEANRLIKEHNAVVKFPNLEYYLTEETIYSNVESFLGKS